MGALAERAKRLVGLPRRGTNGYVCNQVVNEVFYGAKNVGLFASTYRTWGVQASEPAEGVVITNHDGSHVGVFISATEFIHSSDSLNEIVRRPTSMAKSVFGEGYILRKER